MSRIKSALELALERSSQVEADPLRVIAYELRKMGKRMVARVRAGEKIDINRALKQHQEGELPAIKEGISEALLQYISLPADHNDCNKYRAAIQCAQAIAPSFRKAEQVLQELERIARQYLEQRNAIVTSLRGHFEKFAQEQMTQLSKTMGAGLQIDVSTLPEFQTELRKAMASHDNQYRAVFNQLQELTKAAL